MDKKIGYIDRKIGLQIILRKMNGNQNQKQSKNQNQTQNQNQNQNKFTLYLICEGTTCEFVEKSMKMGRLSSSPSVTQSGICDYGLIESFYFNHNTRNTDLFENNRSLYLVATKPSAIDTALIVYAGDTSGSSPRRVYPVPYANASSRYTKTRSQIRSIMDMFGKNSDVNNYMAQPKYSSFTEFLPLPNVRLDWSITQNDRYSSLGAYQSPQVASLLAMIQEYRDSQSQGQGQGQVIDRVFLVCEPELIMAMINMVGGNRFTQQDLIEHTSMWAFQIEAKRSFFGGVKHMVKSRNKLYPLMRNPGYLHTFDRLFYYLYKDAKVPLFQYNRLIPASYLQPKFLTLCSRFLVYAMKSKRGTGQKRVAKGKGSSSSSNSLPKSSLGKLLKSFGKQSNFTK